MHARVPHSVSASSRSCGRRPPRGTPNAAALPALGAASSVVPSQAVSRRPNANADGIPAVASGPRHRSNSSSNGLEPSRSRPLSSAAAEGSTVP